MSERERAERERKREREREKERERKRERERERERAPEEGVLLNGTLPYSLGLRRRPAKEHFEMPFSMPGLISMKDVHLLPVVVVVMSIERNGL